jgi:hypothetical protein
MHNEVNADLESVMAWWFHPDRKAEYFDKVKTKGALDLSVSDSTEGGVRIRTIGYKTAKGWEFVHRLSVHLGENGLPLRVHDGDGFVVQSSDVLDARSGAQHFTVTCSAVQEFLPKGPHQTQVSARHEHTMSGGTWGQRRYRRKTDQSEHRRSFREMIQQCEAAVGPTEDTAGAM